VFVGVAVFVGVGVGVGKPQSSVVKETLHVAPFTQPWYNQFVVLGEGIVGAEL